MHLNTYTPHVILHWWMHLKNSTSPSGLLWWRHLKDFVSPCGLRWTGASLSCMSFTSTIIYSTTCHRRYLESSPSSWLNHCTLNVCAVNKPQHKSNINEKRNQVSFSACLEKECWFTMLLSRDMDKIGSNNELYIKYQHSIYINNAPQITMFTIIF